MNSIRIQKHAALESSEHRIDGSVARGPIGANVDARDVARQYDCTRPCQSRRDSLATSSQRGPGGVPAARADPPPHPVLGRADMACFKHVGMLQARTNCLSFQVGKVTSAHGGACAPLRADDRLRAWLPGGLQQGPPRRHVLRDCRGRDAASRMWQGLLAPVYTGGMCVLYRFCRPSPPP